MATDPVHERLLAIALRLPEATEDWPWGSIHCKVAGKIFVGWGRGDDGNMSIGIRTSLGQQSMLVASDPRFSVAKYVGKYGGIDMRLGARPDWNEVEHFIVESYRIIAPKKLVKVLDTRSPAKGEGPSAAPAKKAAAAPKRKAAAPKTKAAAPKKKAAAPAKKAAAPKKAAARK